LRFDGSAHAAERAPVKTCPAIIAASEPPPTQVPAHNYLAEVFHATGEHEEALETSRTSLSHRHAEALSAAAAPRLRREAPCTLAQAYARPDVDSWMAAMREELASLQSKGVYELMQLPAGHNPIALRWVFTYKLRPDGAVERYKARLVAKGFTQEFGVDFIRFLGTHRKTGSVPCAPCSCCHP
jgi:hypothetical protein